MKKFINPVFFAAFFAVAAFLRIFSLEHQSLWNDEMFSFDAALKPFTEIQSHLIASYHHPPLFFYLAHCSLSWFGETAWALRFISVIFGSLTVALAYSTGAKLLGRKAGIIAALLLLTAPFHLAYSQEGRPYALAAFLCLLSTFYFIQLLQESKKTARLGYVLTSIALLYTHHWGVFVIASHGASLLFQSGGLAHIRKIFLPLWMLIGILYLPEAYALLHQATAHEPSVWFWVQRPSVWELWWVVLAYSGTFFKFASSIFEMPAVLQWIGGMGVLLLLASTVWYAIRKKGDMILRALLLCLVGMLFVPFIISFFKPEVFLWYRYTVIALPLVAILCASALMKWRSVGIALTVVFVGINVAGVVHYFSWQKSNVKDVAAYVDDASRTTNTSLIIRPKTFAPLLNYYYKGTVPQYDEAYLETPLGEIVDTAQSFVYVALDVPNEIRKYMDGHFDKISERKFPGEAHMGMVVEVYKQKPDE